MTTTTIAAADRTLWTPVTGPVERETPAGKAWAAVCKQKVAGNYYERYPHMIPLAVVAVMTGPDDLEVVRVFKVESIEAGEAMIAQRMGS